MYRMFCKSYRNYMKVNRYETQSCREESHDFRAAITRPIGVLADAALYAGIRKDRNDLLWEVGNLVHAIRQGQERFPSFRAFSWELYGYGFDAEPHDGFPEDVLEEQLKLVDLLLSCHYWQVA